MKELDDIGTIAEASVKIRGLRHSREWLQIEEWWRVAPKVRFLDSRLRGNDGDHRLAVSEANPNATAGSAQPSDFPSSGLRPPSPRERGEGISPRPLAGESATNGMDDRPYTHLHVDRVNPCR